MSGEVAYGDIYNLGYEDAKEDLRKYLQHILKPTGDPKTGSYYAGWNAAVEHIVQDSLCWNAERIGAQ